MPKQVSPANAWVFTLNNYTEDDLKFLSSKFSAEPEKYYFIYGKEVAPTSGTPHLQGYIKSRVKSKSGPLQKWRPFTEFAPIKRAHWQRAKGNLESNFHYCSKEGNFETNIPNPEDHLIQALSIQEKIQKRCRILKQRIDCYTADIDEIREQFEIANEDDYELYYEVAGAKIEAQNELWTELNELCEIWPASYTQTE